GSLLLAIIGFPFARHRARLAGARTAHPELMSRADRAKDRALFVASLVPAIMFSGMVLAGSFKGLTAFGRDVLRWDNGVEYLVPGTLAGVAIGFGVLACRALRRRRSPDRAYRVVWGAAIASSTINFSHEYQVSHNIVGGGYLGLLSLFGMVMFHEFLDQFSEG